MPIVGPGLRVPFRVGGALPPTPESLARVHRDEAPHIAALVEFTSKGKLVTVEEGTPECTVARAFHVAVCPEGFREDNPSFGVPEVAFKTLPLNLQSFEEAIKRSEPAASSLQIEAIANR